ncbi:MAG: hypothetical protein H0U52_16895 [Chloroflexi bacterium]|nr:hypothetical protein [Chloroflexota bacterium]
MPDQPRSDGPTSKEALVESSKHLDDDPKRNRTSRPDPASSAADFTGVDPQESLTRDDPSNAIFRDRVPEEPRH